MVYLPIVTHDSIEMGQLSLLQQRRSIQYANIWFGVQSEAIVYHGGNGYKDGWCGIQRMADCVGRSAPQKWYLKTPNIRLIGLVYLVNGDWSQP